MAYTTWDSTDTDSDITLSGSDLVTKRTGAAGGASRGNIGAVAGKWYWEVTIANKAGAGIWDYVGIVNLDDVIGGKTLTNTYNIFYTSSGKVYKSSNYISCDSWTTGDVIGVAIDLATGKVWFAKNGTWQNSGDPAAGTGQCQTITYTDRYFPQSYLADLNDEHAANFGQNAFTHSVPSGFNSGLYGEPQPYTTWNPSDKDAKVSLTLKNLIAKNTTGGNDGSIRTKTPMSSGKFYWEYDVQGVSTNREVYVGVMASAATLDGYVGEDATGWGYRANGNKYIGGSGSSYGNNWTTNDVIGVALDMDAGKIWFAKNGVWQDSGDPEAGTGEAFSGITGSVYAAMSSKWLNRGVMGWFGLATLFYTPPSGFASGVSGGNVDADAGPIALTALPIGNSPENDPITLTTSLEGVVLSANVVCDAIPLTASLDGTRLEATIVCDPILLQISIEGQSADITVSPDPIEVVVGVRGYYSEFITMTPIEVTLGLAGGYAHEYIVIATPIEIGTTLTADWPNVLVSPGPILLTTRLLGEGVITDKAEIILYFYSNGQLITTKTIPLTPALTGQEWLRTRFPIELKGRHLSIKVECTGSNRETYLYDYGLDLRILNER